ncbi:MAG: hypothetical protein ACK5Y2_12555 [Bdellovibrionales bacterium]
MRVFVFLLSLILLAGCSNDAGFSMPEQQQEFSSTLYNNKVDIIWLVDESSSMKKHQEKLSNEVEAMVQKLNELKLDYRMVMTTTSVGPGNSGGTYFGQPAVLTSTSPSLVATLKGRLLRGEMGSDNERGILSLQNLLSDSYVNGDGRGFHRPESLLLINVLSDEDDGTDGTRESVVQTLSNRLNVLKKPYRPGVGGWLLNFIGVIDNHCQDQFGRVNLGLRYMDLVQLSGGRKFSICAGNLKPAVEGLQSRVLEILTDYPIAQIPNVATIRVYKNGILVPRSATNGWDYIPTLNVIRFYGSAVPAADSAIRVEFTPASAS